MTHAIGTPHITPRIVMRDAEIFVICVSINRSRRCGWKYRSCSFNLASESQCCHYNIM